MNATTDTEKNDRAVLIDASEDDRVIVRYESRYGENGDEQVITGTVVRVDIHEWRGSEATTITLDIAHEGKDERRDFYKDTDRTRRVELNYNEGEFLYATVYARNGGRWNTISRARPEPAVEFQ